MIGGQTQVVDSPDDDPVIAGGVFGDDLTLEGSGTVDERRYAAATGLQVKAGETVRPGRGGAQRERSCCRPNTFKPKCRARRMRDQVSELRDGQNETRAARARRTSASHDQPRGSPSGAAVTKATRMANRPSAFRNARASDDEPGGGWSCERSRWSWVPSPGRRRRGSRRLGWRRAVHGGEGLDVAVGAREGLPFEVAAPPEGERAVHDTSSRLADERLAACGLGEQRAELSGAAVGGRVRSAVLVDQRGGARQARHMRQRGRRRCRPPACAGAHRVMRPARPPQATRSADWGMPSEAAAWNSPASRFTPCTGSGRRRGSRANARTRAARRPQARSSGYRRRACRARPVVVDHHAGRPWGPSRSS